MHARAAAYLVPAARDPGAHSGRTDPAALRECALQEPSRVHARACSRARAPSTSDEDSAALFKCALYALLGARSRALCERSDPIADRLVKTQLSPLTCSLNHFT